MGERIALDYTRPAERDWLGTLARGLAAYPVLTVGALYSGWATAWLQLGRRPVPSLDDPASISGWVDVARWVFMVLFIGLLPTFAVHLGVGVAAVVEWRRGGRSIGGKELLVAAAALAIWAGAFALLRTDPWNVGVWYMD